LLKGSFTSDAVRCVAVLRGATLHHNTTHQIQCDQTLRQQQQQPFYGSVEFVRENPGEPVPEEHSPTTLIVVINHPYQLSLFNPRALQSFSTICLQVFFGLPLGLVPSTSYSIHFLTQSLTTKINENLSEWHEPNITFTLIQCA